MFADLYVVAVISNPERYKSRYTLYRNFEKYVIDSGAKLYTVEAAFGERPYEVTSGAKHTHIQLRTKSEIWHKENLINIGISRLPDDWKYVAWIDADIVFARPDWVAETIHQLQHFDVVQMFSYPTDLDPNYNLMPNFRNKVSQPAAWAYCYVHDAPHIGTEILKKKIAVGDLEEKIKNNKFDLEMYALMRNNYYWHPGFAWAIRREAFDALGGLIDYSILGSADRMMAAALTGEIVLPDWMSPSFKRWIYEWQNRAHKYIKGNVGYVPGLLLHNWHGNKHDRGYNSRWAILADNKFDPELDLKRDWQGLWQLTDRSQGLRDQIRFYHRQRNEDSVDVLD